MKKFIIITFFVFLCPIIRATPLNIYRNIQPILFKHTDLPILLPPSAILKKATDFDKLLSPSNIRLLTPSAYSINFDYTANCKGSAACSIGNFFVATISKKMPANESQSFPLSMQQIQWLKQNKLMKDKNHIPVTLTPHHVGFLEKQHSTGVGSSLFRTLSWVNKETLYQLTLKGIKQKSMIKIAQTLL